MPEQSLTELTAALGEAVRSVRAFEVKAQELGEHKAYEVMGRRLNVLGARVVGVEKKLDALRCDLDRWEEAFERALGVTPQVMLQEEHRCPNCGEPDNKCLCWRDVRDAEEEAPSV